MCVTAVPNYTFRATSFVIVTKHVFKLAHVTAVWAHRRKDKDSFVL